MGMNVESGIRQGAPEYADYDYDEQQAAKKRRLIVISGVVLLVLLAAAWFMLRGGDKPVAKPAALPTVTVITPGSTTVQGTISATGSLAAKREMPVGVAGEGGMVRSVLVEPGTWVKAGQTLAIIDRSVQAEQANSQAASVKVAQADAAIAQSDFERARALVARGFISKADLDRKGATRDAAVARVAVARAQFGQMQAQIGRLDIRSPAAGLVLTRTIEPGQIVGPSSGALFRVAKDGELEMKALLAEQDLARLKIGDSAQVTPIGGTQAFTGRIWQISPVIDPQTRQGTARIQLSYNPALRPGGFASADLQSGNVLAPRVPESAVLSDDKGSYVYIVNPDGSIARRDVKIGDVSDAGVVILSGINGSEKIVLAAGAFLNPGDKVKPELAKPTAVTR
jgi:HlyD family secretion protein